MQLHLCLRPRASVKEHIVSRLIVDLSTSVLKLRRNKMGFKTRKFGYLSYHKLVLFYVVYVEGEIMIFLDELLPYMFAIGAALRIGTDSENSKGENV